jgi:hypothetical protein
MNNAEALRQLEVMYEALRDSDVLLAQSQQLLQKPILHPGPKGLTPLDMAPWVQETEGWHRGSVLPK